jgi:hypothetical protein
MEETGTFEEISEHRRSFLGTAALVFNLPQEAPQAFAEAVVDVAAG